MNYSLLQKAIENYDIDNFKRYWEKTSDKADFISKNKDEQFTALLKDYLNKKIQQIIQKHCSKNCDGKHAIDLASLQILYDTYGSRIDHLFVKSLTIKYAAQKKEKKHDLTAFHWSLLSYQQEHSQLLEKLYQIVPNIDLNDFFDKNDIIKQATKTKKSPLHPINKLVIFEGIKTYFYYKHLKYTTLANKKIRKLKVSKHVMSSVALILPRSVFY